MSSNNSRNEKLRREGSNSVFGNGFDFASYPMTNPPLFDQSMFVNYNQDGTPVLRRRISISNGQIGQIINHEAIFDENYELLSEDTTPIESNDKSNYKEYSQDIAQTSLQFSNSHIGLLNDISVPPQQVPLPQVQQVPQVPQQLPVGAHSQQLQNDLFTHQSVPLRTGGSSHPIDLGPRDLGPKSGPGSVPPNIVPQVPPPPSQFAPVPGPMVGRDVDRDHSSFAGVPPPNHQLIYNNEVIYNPNDGPVPGTAAWKRDRLLERNRVAASKCRKRKKQAQQQVMDDVRDLKMENNDLRGKLDSYDKFFKLIQAFFVKTSNFENFDSTADEFDMISKALKTENRKQLLDVLDTFDLEDPNIKQEYDSV